MGFYARTGVYLGTGGSWAITIACATLDIEIKVYLLSWLLTLILSLTTVVLILMRPDHGLLAEARIQLRAMQAEAALAEIERDMELARRNGTTPPQEWPPTHDAA